MQHSVTECISELQNDYDVLDVIFCDNQSIVDLYTKVQSLHRLAYENNQRILFVITEDTSQSENLPGQSLQNLQSIINDIDISNFFVCLVSTNPNLENDYNYVLENISQDSVPFHLYQCQGNYKKKISDELDIFCKYTSLRDYVQEINNLQEDQQNLLFENHSFCMLAWTGINVEPNNRVRPCCEFNGSLGDSSIQSLEEIWNSPGWKKIRKDMLEGIPIKECRACYEKEKMGRDTLRKSSNRLLIDKIDLVDQTAIDGNLNAFNLSYWDIRYNNLCNLSCRSCNAESSSSWYRPALTLGSIKHPRSPILIAGKNDHDIFDQIIQHTDHVKQIYFAGGEPSMIEEFYQILELLDEKKRNDVRLCYNINMSRLHLKKRSLLDLWKKFPKVSIGASLDGECHRGEYLRQGLAWEDVVNNRQQMIENCPHIDFYVSATVSILNVLHLPDFHRSWVEQELIKPEDFNIQLLFGPLYLRIDKSPLEMKEKIREKYARHLEWLIPQDPLGRAVYGFRSVLAYVENHNEFDADDFWDKIDSLDQYHGSNMLEIFPELHFLPKRS
jgi:MoaA/NifB/PqqE/SkfB family radical SAM enzyme